MSTLDHVRSFLSPLPVSNDLTRLINARIKAAAADPHVAELQGALRQRIYQIKFRPETIRLYNRLSNYGLAISVPGLPDFVGPLLVAGYLRTKDGLAMNPTSVAPPALVRMTEHSIQVFDDLQAREPEFFDEMLLELSVQAARDPTYLQQLQVGATELRSLMTQSFPSIPARPAPVETERHAAEWLTYGSELAAELKVRKAPGWVHEVVDAVWDVCVAISDAIKA